MKEAKSWWVLIKDDDRNQFCITGPVFDDTDVTARTVQEQEKGRKIRIETIPSDRTKESIIESWSAQSGQTYTSDYLL